MTSKEENSPYIKEHDGSHICFADNLAQCKNALERKSLKKDEAAKLDKAHLMLFGIDKWDKSGINGLKGAFKHKNNKFSRLEVFGCELKKNDQIAFGELLSPENLSNVKRFDLDNTKLDPEGARVIFSKICEVPSIETLNLQGSIEGKADVMAAISDKLVENSNIFKGLKKLDLKINELGKESAASIGSLLERMTGNESEVDLFYNDLGADGAKHIAKSLSQPTIAITFLDLSCNNIGDEGGKAIGAMLRVNRTLKVLKLALNNIGNEGALPIFQAIGCHPGDPNQNFCKSLELFDISANVMKENGVGNPGKDNTPLKIKEEYKKLQAKVRALEEEDELGVGTNPKPGFEEEHKKLKAEEIAFKGLDPLAMKFPLTMSLVYAIQRGNVGDFDFTGIELDEETWRHLAEQLAMTKNSEYMKARGKFKRIRFSIVDLMNAKNLDIVQKILWDKPNEGDNSTNYLTTPSSGYYKLAHIDWRRRDEEADKKNPQWLSTYEG